MSNSQKGFTTISIVLGIFLVLSVVGGIYFLTKDEGKPCGGFVGEQGNFACPVGYKCQYPSPKYPDAQGKCVNLINSIFSNSETTSSTVSPTTQPVKTSITSTPTPINETTNWKTYTSKNIGISFKYPPDWNINEEEKVVYSVHLIKDPDIRGIVGACPGFSLSVSSFDKMVNYSVFSPVEKDIFKDESVEIYETTNQYGCYTKVIFINKFPTDSIKPKLVISLISKTTKPVIFDQILSTFKFN